MKMLLAIGLLLSAGMASAIAAPAIAAPAGATTCAAFNKMDASAQANLLSALQSQIPSAGTGTPSREQQGSRSSDSSMPGMNNTASDVASMCRDAPSMTVGEAMKKTRGK